MAETNNKLNTNKEPKDYQVDLVGALHTLNKRKKLIIVGIIASTLLAVVLSLTLTKVYRSRGFVQFSDPSQEKDGLLFSVASQMLEASRQAILLQLKDMGLLDMFNELKIEDIQTDNFHLMTIQDFKKYAAAFRNYQQFLRFAKQNKYLTDDEIKQMRSSVPGTTAFTKLIKETYALSKDDIKNFSPTLLKEKNYVVGADVEMTASNSEVAQKALTAMADFIRYSILEEKVNEYAAFQFNDAKDLIERYASYILNIRSMLGLLQTQSEKLQILASKFPLTAKIGDIQARISDLERMIAIFEIERQKSVLFSDFFFKLKLILAENPNSPDVLFAQWDMLRKDFFKDKKKDDIVILLAMHAFDMDANRFRTFYEKTLQVGVKPSLPGTPEWPQKRLFVIFGFFVGALFFVLLAFALEFWEKNRNTIQAPQKPQA